MFDGCEKHFSRTRGVNRHRQLEHPEFTGIQPLAAHCICGYPKYRSSNKKYVLCPNPFCGYYFCNVEPTCNFNGATKSSMKTHIRDTHYANQVKGKQTCMNCGKDTKNRDAQKTIGQCTHCGWYWCLVENCLAEYEELSSLKWHQKFTHRI